MCVCCCGGSAWGDQKARRTPATPTRAEPEPRARARTRTRPRARDGGRTGGTPQGTDPRSRAARGERHAWFEWSARPPIDTGNLQVASRSSTYSRLLPRSRYYCTALLHEQYKLQCTVGRFSTTYEKYQRPCVHSNSSLHVHTTGYRQWRCMAAAHHGRDRIFATEFSRPNFRSSTVLLVRTTLGSTSLISTGTRYLYG